MEGAEKLQIGTPEEAAFRRCYNDLRDAACNPVEFSEILLSMGIISRETRDSIALDRDEVHAKRALLDSVQYAIAQSSDKNGLLSDLYKALLQSGVPNDRIYWMEDFITGE